MLHLKECPLDASTCYFVLRYYIDIYIVSLQQSVFATASRYSVFWKTTLLKTFTVHFR